MLEVRQYTKNEIAQILHTRDNQGIQRKLDRWGIKFSVTGRGGNCVYIIQKIPEKRKFKILCMTDLGMNPQTDFTLFRNFVYYFMNDPDFRWLPDTALEQKMTERGSRISRQTIRAYKRCMERANLIYEGGEYVYYFAARGQLRRAEAEEYKAAWAEYWKYKERLNHAEAMARIFEKYGGYPKKHSTITGNAFTQALWNKLNALACAGVERELSNSD